MKIYRPVLKRVFDICLSAMLLGVLFPMLLLIFGIILALDGGPAIYWSDRVGFKNKIFKMPKYRTMKLGTPEVATNYLKNPNAYMTRIGPFLRKTSLDEFPQLWSILIGDMSFVGPRPALFNQYDLISIRTNNGVDDLLPGLTGWAQVNGRDELSIVEKLRFDCEYSKRCSLMFDLKILWLTFVKVWSSANISH